MGRGDDPLHLSVTVVIPAYNEEEGVRTCLESVLRQTVAPDQVIVVDDGSTDGTPLILEEFRGRVEVVTLVENSGNKALALRAALPHIRGDVVIYTDADSELDPRAIELLLAHFLDPRVGAVSGIVVSRRHNILTSVRELQYIMGQEVYKRGMGVLGTVMVIPGCVGAVRRDLFDPSPDTVTEDMDQTLTVMKAGHRVVYEPRAVALTSDPPNLHSYVRQSWRWFSGYFQNVRKHFSSLPRGMKFQMAYLSVENILGTVTPFLMVYLASAPRRGSLALAFVLGEVASWLAIALYGALRLRRIDLIPAALISPVVRVIDGFLWTGTAVSELLLNRRDVTWRRADRFRFASEAGELRGSEPGLAGGREKGVGGDGSGGRPRNAPPHLNEPLIGEPLQGGHDPVPVNVERV
ncbi:MAG: hypothetical protein DRO01_01695 [Thermoproteota archaeon]|nr:MAG: hypothetical protein DRO01_01695 [Candidatus Korarchaeota archaeon]